MAKQPYYAKPILWLVVSVTLGLAPFVPEPHVWEKLKWVLAGAGGMRLIDWFDLLLHGSPWVFLTYSLVDKFARNRGEDQ